MKQRIFTHLFLLLFMMVCVQTIRAAQGDKTTYQISWSHSNLNSLTDGKFVKQSGNGLVNVSIYGTDATPTALRYRDDLDSEEMMSKGVGRLVLGYCTEGKFNFALAWSPSQSGYTLQAVDARTLVRSYTAWGIAKAWIKWGEESEQSISKGGYDVTEEVKTSNIAATATTLPFYFRRDASTQREFNMTKLQMDLYIIPNAPTWKKATDDVKVTVNHTEDAYLHWIDLSSYISVGNSAFAGTVKYEAVGMDAKYIVWNDTHDKCYIIKPGTYQFRAYIDKQDGVYCASAYSTNYLTLTAKADATEKANAQIFYMVDDQLVDEVDKTNHVWEVSLVGPSNDHWVEYVYAYDGDLLYERQTTTSIGYLSDTYNRKDHFNVYAVGGVDSTIVTNSTGGARSWLRINSTKAGNHVKVIMDSELMKNTLVTAASDNIAWVESRHEMKFGQTTAGAYTTKRSFEITFTGVPDSLIMHYGNSAESHSGDVTLMIEYYDGAAWSELKSIKGRPNTLEEERVRYSYQLQPNTSKLRFTYWNAQYSGYIKEITVTERKGFAMSVALDSVLQFSGVHQKGGMEVKNVDLKWYNLYPSFQDTLHGFNPDRFAAQPSGVKPLALDDYQENGKVQLGLKLDVAGVFSTYYMIWNGTPDTKVIVPGGKSVYGFLLQGVVKYGSDELEVKNTLPSDTVKLELGDKLPNPFQVQDSTGKVLTDSVNYEYEFLPSSSAEVDSMGNIVAKCVGYTRVIATLKENSLVPGGLKDTLYLYVAEQEPNKIIWNIPTVGIGRKDVLTNLATAADGAAISYAFNPAFAKDLGNNTIQIADTVGDMFVTATAAQSCEHMKKDSTIVLKILDIIEDKHVVVKDSGELKDVVPGDSIKDLVVILDEKGDTLVPPAIQTTYQFIPTGSAKVVDGSIIVINHAVDPIVVIATTTGKNIKTRVDTIYLHPKHDWEEIEFTKAMLDTMLVGTEYPIGGYITTKSGNGADTLFVDKPLASKVAFHQGKRSVTPKDSGVVVINAVAYGNADYWGPDTATHKVALVYKVKDIDWEKALKPLDLQDLRLYDTIPTSTVPVMDGNGNDITNEVTKSYEIIPNPSGDAEVTPEGNIVVTKATDVMVVVTTSGKGYETKKDTLYMHIKSYKNIQIEFPTKPAGEDYQPGDTIDTDEIKILDEKGNDITDLCNKEITWEPKENAHLDKDSNLVIDKYGDLEIIVKVTGDGVDSTEFRDSIQVQAIEVGKVEYPTEPQDGYYVGDVIDTDSIRVYDAQGNDITDKAEIEYSFKPKDGAHVDSLTGNIVIDKPGKVVIQTKIGGKVVETTTDEKEIAVEKYKTGKIILPEKKGDDDYVTGDKINKDEIVVKDEDGKDISDKATITITWEPTDGAHLDSDGNLVFDKAGQVLVNVCVSGDALTEKCTEETYVVRHNEDGCYDLMTQVWNDVLVISNNEEENIQLGLPRFVSYQWYREEELLPGEVNQDYHISAGEILDSAYYYAIAKGTDNKEYLICEMLVKESSAPVASTSFKVYPTMVATSATYTVEVEQAGVLYVTNSTGSAVSSQKVEKGKNVMNAPQITGVYVLQFAPQTGKYEVQKLTVK